MGSKATNNQYVVYAEFTAASWSGRTLNYSARLKVYAGNTYYIDLNSSGSLSGTGATTATISGNTSLNGNYTYTDIKTISGSVAANAAGDASVSISGTFGTDYPFYYNGNQIGLKSVTATDSATWHISTPPNEPAWTEVTRNSATNFYIRYTQPGGGPACTYYVQRSTSSNMSGYEETGANPAAGGFNWTATENKTYYFRVRSTNSDGTTYSPIVGPYYGRPDSPTSVTPTQSTTSTDRISVAIGAPAYGGNLQSYTVVRNGTPSATFTGVTANPYVDTDSTKIPGNSYTYTVVAVGSAFNSLATTSGSVTSSGAPYAPTSAPTVTKVGRNVTVTSPAVSGDGGVAITTSNANEGYFVQYQSSSTSGGTYSAWSTPIKMSNQVNRTHTFTLMDPALWYKFRVYAANDVIYASNASTILYYPHNNIAYTANFSDLSTTLFVSAGGRRYRNDTEKWKPTEIAKRYAGSSWVDLTLAKRYDPSYTDPVTGSHWKDLV